MSIGQRVYHAGFAREGQVVAVLPFGRQFPIGVSFGTFGPGLTTCWCESSELSEVKVRP